MRKIDAQYIVNIARQFFRKACIKDAEQANQSLQEAEMDPCINAETVFAEILSNPHLFMRLPVAWDDDPTMRTVIVAGVKKMASTTLGRIISFGLKVGEVCTVTYRKTPFRALLKEPLITAPIDRFAGRELLEQVATAVIIAAVRDYIFIVRRIRNHEGQWDEVGRAYINEKGNEMST